MSTTPASMESLYPFKLAINLAQWNDPEPLYNVMAEKNVLVNFDKFHVEFDLNNWVMSFSTQTELDGVVFLIGKYIGNVDDIVLVEESSHINELSRLEVKKCK